MKMTKELFIDKLVNKSKENNIDIDYEKAEKLYLYKELLLEWNDKINLTSITDDDDIIVKHFIDSLLCIDYISKGSNIIDVGTGAGFPGIVISIYFGDSVNVVLLDSLNKRISFLNDVIEKLKLKNVKTIHGRAEEIAHNINYRENFDIAIARAVAPLNILLEYLVGYIKNEGICICMKSLSAKNEIEEAKKAIIELGLSCIKEDERKIDYKDDSITRMILVLKKNKLLSSKYPRLYSKIKKNPL